jgi:hypothetical protein
MLDAMDSADFGHRGASSAAASVETSVEGRVEGKGSAGG